MKNKDGQSSSIVNLQDFFRAILLGLLAFAAYQMMLFTREDLTLPRMISELQTELSDREPSPVRTQLKDEELDTMLVVSYNIFNIPYVPDHIGQIERTCRIPASLYRMTPHADVIIIQEMFREGCHKDQPFDQSMEKYGWRYKTIISGDEGPSWLNGGVQIFSRWPILLSSELKFKQDCIWHSADYLCNKGVLYAKIAKGPRIYHILGTHLQSQDGQVYHMMRLRQAQTIATFLGQLAIPAQESVILGGDLNTDLVNQPQEANEIFKVLGMAHCEVDSGSIKYTYDRSVNNVVNSNEDPSWLDYVLYSTAHRVPKKCSFRGVRLISEKPFNVCRRTKIPLWPYWVDWRSKMCLKHMETEHLSDHFPVFSHFMF